MPILSKTCGKLTIPLLILLAISFFGLPAQAKYGGGTGQPNDPYLIYDAIQMNAIGANPGDWDKHFELMDDIDLSGLTRTSYNIIGTDYDNVFTGVFDGNGHTISNFTYTSTGTSYIALFGYVYGPNAEIKDLGLIDPDVDAGTGDYVGSLVGYLQNGTVSNCYVEAGSVSGEQSVGGLVGGNAGTISNCYVGAGSVSGDHFVGGLMGSNFDTVIRCYSAGSVSGGQSVGGLMGGNTGTISNCYVGAGSISGDRFVGGLMGSNVGTVTRCYSAGSVSGGQSVGGLVGRDTGEVTGSFWDIQTSGQTTSAGGTGKTTAQMQTATTFTAWICCDCDPVWTLDEGADYPRLAWENAPGEPITVQLLLGGGSGTQADPYLIYTAEQLNTIGLIPCDLEKHFKLMANIDLSTFTGTSFNIIGYYVSWDNNKPFTGTFDGNGHTISNFTYTSTGTNYVGLFGYVDDPNAEIKDLGLIDSDVDAGTGDYAGSLVGMLSRGTITNCYVDGASVAGAFRVGGLVGNNNGAITSSCATASVSGGIYVGGLVGNNDGTITNCYAEGGSVAGNYVVGGLVGLNVDTVTRCYSAGIASGEQVVGGLVGYNWEGEVTNSFWDIETSGQSTSDGGAGKTTAQMQTANTFVRWACDFVWTIDEGNDYPRLSWENKPGEPIPTPSYGGGSGDPNDPYLIYTAEQLNTIGLITCHWDKNFKLMADIDLSGRTYETAVIAPDTDNSNSVFDGTAFTGVFDGSGYKITGLTIDDGGAGNDHIGLFGLINSGEVSNLGLEGSCVSGDRWVSGLVGRLDDGSVLNCYSTGDASGSYSVGGLVGRNDDGSVLNCYSTGSVSGNGAVGGLVGCNYEGTITNCYSTSSVSGNNRVGGLVGHNCGTITNCYSTGSVTGEEGVGGLAGENNRNITNCCSTGDVSGFLDVGGLVGCNYEGTITNCYSTSSVSGNNRVGGLVGHNCGTISNSYSTGEVSAVNSVGGLLGEKEAGTITDSFWDTETSGQTTSAGGTGKTTAEMQMASTFIDAGWDFNTPIWTIDEGLDYPRLWWELVPVLHAEPEITLGTSNTITWEPVPGANDYYAECAGDANFTSILHSIGWITETSCEFTGLQLGQRYWYSVKARNSAGIETSWSNVESSLQGTLDDLVDAIDTMLDPDTLKNKNMKKALMNKINAVLEMLDEQLYADALNKLQNDILKKTDGCAETGRPDRNDWIITCEGQSQVYPLVIETIEYVRGLMNQ